MLSLPTASAPAQQPLYILHAKETLKQIGLHYAKSSTSVRAFLDP